MEKFFEQVCLLEQPYMRDNDKTIQDLIKEKIASIGENIQVRRFVRFERGEGLEKPADDFAAEVEAQLSQQRYERTRPSVFCFFSPVFRPGIGLPHRWERTASRRESQWMVRGATHLVAASPKYRRSC